MNVASYRFAIVVDRMPTHLETCALGPIERVERVATDIKRGSPIRLIYNRPAEDLAEAVISAIREVESVGLRALRVVDDDDWVTVGDIAARIGVSRETVRLWAAGAFGPGNFPPPLNQSRYTTFYSWAEVHPWLRERVKADTAGPQTALVGIGLALRLRALASRVRPFNSVVQLLTAPEPPRRRTTSTYRRPDRGSTNAA